MKTTQLYREVSISKWQPVHAKSLIHYSGFCKTFLLFIFLVAITGQLAARGSKADTTTKIEFMQWWEPEMKQGSFGSVIAEFEKMNPDIQVKLISLPYSEVQSQVVIGAASSSISDVIGIDGAWVNALLKQNVLEPLDQYIQKTSFPLEDMADVTIINGQKWMFPVATFIYPLFYNKAMLQEANVEPPTTRAEFRTAAKALTDAGRHGWSLPLSLQNPNGVQNDLLSWLWASGASAIPGGKPALQTPELAQVLEFVQTLYRDGSIAPGINAKQEQEKVEEFVNDRVAMIISSVAHINLIRQRNPELDFGITPLPVQDGYTGKPGISYAAWGIGMSSAGKNKDAAWALIADVLSTDTNSFIATNANAFPGNKTSQPDSVQNDPMFAEAFAIFQRSTLRNEFVGAPNAINLMRDLATQVQKVLGDQASIDAALEAAQQAWQDEFAK